MNARSFSFESMSMPPRFNVRLRSVTVALTAGSHEVISSVPSVTNGTSSHVSVKLVYLPGLGTIRSNTSREFMCLNLKPICPFKLGFVGAAAI